MMRGNKYGNRRTKYNGAIYDSKAEANYAMMLDVMRKASREKDRVAGWERQVPYPIFIEKVKVFTYYADFVVNYADGHQEIIDVKGYKTEVYKLKKKCVEAFYGKKIAEVAA